MSRLQAHEPPEDESGAPRVVEGGLAGRVDAVAVVELVLLEVFGAHGGRMRRAGCGSAAGSGRRLRMRRGLEPAGSTRRARNLIGYH